MDRNENLHARRTGTRGLQLLRVVWLSIALGILLELIVLAVMTLARRSEGPLFFVVDLAQKVSWSLVVCIAVAAGITLHRIAQPYAAGFVALLASPVAFALARGVHKAAASSLQVTLSAAPAVAPSLWVIALIKGLEFGLLGALLAWMVGKPWAGAKAYAGSGLLAGLSFGTLLVAYTYAFSNPHPAASAMVAQCLNELVYPVGCALVVYASGEMGTHIAEGHLLRPSRPLVLSHAKAAHK